MAFAGFCAFEVFLHFLDAFLQPLELVLVGGHLLLIRSSSRDGHQQQADTHEADYAESQAFIKKQGVN